MPSDLLVGRGGAGAPIVLVHGLMGRGTTWSLQLPWLTELGEVYTYDAPWHRGRDVEDPHPVSTERFVDELDSIRAALAIERWHVLGHSWGGTIALEYGARRPAGLASAILASPLISTSSWIADANALRGELPADARATLTACEAAVPPPQADCDKASAVFYRAYNGREKASDLLRSYAASDKAAGSRGLDARLYETMWGNSEFVSTGTLRPGSNPL